MKTKTTNLALVAALWAVLVVGTYALNACCYTPENEDACRNVLISPPDSTVTINGEECDITSDSSYDDQVGWNFQTCTSGVCAWNTTYCDVAYQCPSDIEFVSYYLPDNSNYPLEAVVFGHCGSDCSLNGCVDCDL